MPKVDKEIAVAAPADTVYQIWRNFENFPSFMHNIEEVRDIGYGRSRWRAKGPLGNDAEWDAEMTADEPARLIAWRSLEGSKVRTNGRVEFDGESGMTRIHLALEYEAPGGALGDIAAKIFSNPERKVEEDLLRFKDGIERGQQFSYPGAGKLAREHDGAPGTAGAAEGRQAPADLPASEGGGRTPREAPGATPPIGRGAEAHAGEAATSDAAPKADPARRDSGVREPNRRHGTPAGSLGSLNETDGGLRDAQESEKSG